VLSRAFEAVEYKCGEGVDDLVVGHPGLLGKMAKTASSNRDAKTAGPLAARMRNLMMPIIFNRFYPRATGWLYDHDLGTLPTGG
jgi:hypothetical protein